MCLVVEEIVCQFIAQHRGGGGHDRKLQSAVMIETTDRFELIIVVARVDQLVFEHELQAMCSIVFIKEDFMTFDTGTPVPLMHGVTPSRGTAFFLLKADHDSLLFSKALLDQRLQKFKIQLTD